MTQIHAASDELRRHLQPGESVRWIGEPDPGRVFGPQDLFLVPFSVVWLSFAVFSTAMALNAPQANVSSAPSLFGIFGAAFCFIGIYFVAGRFVTKAIIRRSTTYVITDRRALSLRGRSLRSSPLAGQPVSYRESRSGHHLTATIGVQARGLQSNMGDLEANGWPGGGSSRDTAVTFYDVLDVQGLRSALIEGALPVSTRHT